MRDLRTIHETEKKAGGETLCYGYPKQPCMLWCPKCRVYHTHDRKDVKP